VAKRMVRVWRLAILLSEQTADGARKQVTVTLSVFSKIGMSLGQDTLRVQNTTPGGQVTSTPSTHSRDLTVEKSQALSNPPAFRTTLSFFLFFFKIVLTTVGVRFRVTPPPPVRAPHVAPPGRGKRRACGLGLQAGR